LDRFLGHYLPVAVEIVFELAIVHNRDSFHEWKEVARLRLMSRIRADGFVIRDNWIQIALALAYENLKAKGFGSSSVPVSPPPRLMPMPQLSTCSLSTR
jgi:hypothetical protein